MAVLMMLGLLVVFGVVWLFFTALWLMFRITFWFVGGILGLALAGVGLLAMGILGLLLLPVTLLFMLHLVFPLLLLVGVIWLALHLTRPAPVIIRR